MSSNNINRDSESSSVKASSIKSSIKNTDYTKESHMDAI